MAIFLIAVVALLAAAVALTSVTQQTGAVRSLQAEQAWYAALARIETEVPGILASGACPSGGAQVIAGFTTTLACSQASGLREGGIEYSVYTLEATASLGTASTASLVRRSARAQFTDFEGP